LAQIDSASNPTQASNDLLQALQLSPATMEDTLLAANLAERTGQTDAAEALRAVHAAFNLERTPVTA
jgi:hypothetical protein